MNSQHFHHRERPNELALSETGRDIFVLTRWRNMGPFSQMHVSFEASPARAIGANSMGTLRYGFSRLTS